MAGRYDALFDQESLREIQEFFDTRDRWRDILEYRQLSAEVGHVKNLFYGDSITDIWPLHEFFPNHSVLNRGIGGDNVNGLYLRLDKFCGVVCYGHSQVASAFLIFRRFTPAKKNIVDCGGVCSHAYRCDENCYCQYFYP